MYMYIRVYMNYNTHLVHQATHNVQVQHTIHTCNIHVPMYMYKSACV